MTHYERGDTLTFEDPWGAIKYKGPGIFMAGGAGITRFLAILRNLSESGKLDGNAPWFSKKTDKGIFLEEEVRAMLGDRLRLLITGEPSTRHENARIDEKYLEPHAGSFDQYFYVCGPERMVKELSTALHNSARQGKRLSRKISILRTCEKITKCRVAAGFLAWPRREGGGNTRSGCPARATQVKPKRHATLWVRAALSNSFTGS